MPKPKLIPFGFAALSLAIYLLTSAMSCTRIEAPLAPDSLTPLPVATPATPQPTATPAATAVVTPIPTPSASVSPTPDGHFQNFEPGNGTPDLYFLDFGSANSVFTTQVFSGTRALQTTIGAVAAGSVRIYPAAASMDITGNSNIWIMVLDQVGEQHIDLTLTDALGVSQTVGSTTMTNPGVWTMIHWNLGSFAGVDLTRIVHGTLQPGIAAVFIFDDMQVGSF